MTPHNGYPFGHTAECKPFLTSSTALEWIRYTAATERRLTKIEMTQVRHAERLAAIEGEAKVVRDAAWHCLRGAAALMLGLLLDQSLNAGALLHMLRLSLAH